MKDAVCVNGHSIGCVSCVLLHKRQPVPAVERVGPSALVEALKAARKELWLTYFDTSRLAPLFEQIDAALSAPPVGDVERLVTQWRNEFDAQDVTTPFEHGVRAGMLRCADQLAAFVCQ